MRKLRPALIALAIGAVASIAVAAPRTVTLAFEGWHCESCASAARIALKKLDGVESIETSVEKGEAVVRYDDAKVTPEKMLEAVQKVGYKGSVRKAPAPVESGSAAAPAAPVAPAVSVAAATDRVLFFEVPLACPAVEGLGCGSLAGPILAEIERSPSVALARVNHPGTLLAVEWKEAGDVRERTRLVESVFQKKRLDAALLDREALAKARTEYASGKWYRAPEIDRLNEEESRVIAARLVARVEKEVALEPERAAALQKDLAAGFLKVFRGAKGSRAELKAVAAKHLDAKGVAKFEEAVDAGLARRPDDAL